MQRNDERLSGPAAARGSGPGSGPGAGVAEQALACLARGEAEQAVALLRKQLRTHPSDAQALHAMACVARAGGNAPVAIALAGRAITLGAEPHFHITLGLALHEAGQGEAARAALNVAVLATPKDPRAHDAMAVVLEAMGRAADAGRALRQALALRPLEAERHMALAAFLARQGRAAQGLEASARALQLGAGSVAAHNLHAMLLDACGRPGEAEPHFRYVAEHMPGSAAALANHGAALFATGAQVDARHVLEASLNLAPDVAQTRTNLGLVLMALGDLPAARLHLATACHLRGGDARLMLNHAGLLVDLGEYEAAHTLLLAAEAGAANARDRARARMNRGVLALARGDFAQGWALFEARQVLLPPPSEAADLAQWDGTPGPDPVLIYGEQGLGDCIQFLRYVESAAQRVPVLLVVPATLRGLVEQTRLGRNSRVQILESGGRGPHAAGARCSLLSLPHCLGMAAPFAWQAAFATGAAQDPRAEQAAGQRVFRLGVCWAGNAGFQFDKRRSINPALLRPLADIAGVRVQALQPEPDGAVAPLPFVADALPVGDVLATARLLARLDMVVSVDTMIVHLAGLLGVPAVLLDRFGGDWRWAGGSTTENGNAPAQSLWYPNVRILRQPAPGVGDAPWLPVVAKAICLVRDAVRKMGKDGCPG
ncbi:MAG: tetratricopeptide repeat protein [Acetobacter sp.]